MVAYSEFYYYQWRVPLVPARSVCWILHIHYTDKIAFPRAEKMCYSNTTGGTSIRFWRGPASNVDRRCRLQKQHPLLAASSLTCQTVEMSLDEWSLSLFRRGDIHSWEMLTINHTGFSSSPIRFLSIFHASWDGLRAGAAVPFSTKYN